VGLAVPVSIAAGHGQSAALEGAAGFAVLAFVLTALAFSLITATKTSSLIAARW